MDTITSRAVSQHGIRATALVAVSRIGVELALAAALIGIAHQLGSYLIGEPVKQGNWLVAASFAVLAGALGVVEIRLGVKSAREEERRIRHAILQRIFAAQAMPKNDAEFSSARLVQLMTDNAERMTDYRQQYLGSTFAALFTPVVITTYITLAIDWRIGLGMLASIPAVPMLVGGFLRAFRGVSARSRAQRAKLTTQYLDAIRHLTLIRLYGAGERIERELGEHGERNRRAIMAILAGNQIVIIILDGIFSLAFVCWSVLLLAWGIDDGRLTATSAGTVLVLLVLLLEPLNQVAGFFYIGMGGIAAKRAIKRYLAMHPDHAERNMGSSTRSSRLAIDATDLTYDYGRGPILTSVSLRVAWGEKVALVGPSGAGKSTILGLVKGGLPIQEGTLAVAGQDIGVLPPADIRKLTASVSQTTWLFAGTIADNLAMVNPHATEEEMWLALTRAHIADDIRRMPRGLNTELGENGNLLSGGQAQRISLARAFLSGRKILLLDEPTSHVDAESEAHIIEAIAGIGADTTVLLVTHRPSLLSIVDKVYHLEGGVLTEGAQK
ncbi:ATP-binding cassette domain-containing protein [Trueperella pecoris]|uniref:ATP-binding cassette domain-containing protein n=1 Tax=Trueperella pecoris TaxID=2733571 RepID=A0A7M1QY41_9ACTO|nr:ATP-binding cassette domain-containing protein [Trueperella pecoris]QOR46949.1 ATP-binding cassette domain-containing protein [Trueperella pecoris]